MKIFIYFWFVLSGYVAYGQRYLLHTSYPYNTDVYYADSSTLIKQPAKFVPGPNKAALLSAVLPGAGQFYNKHYLKIPFIYAGLGYFAYQSQKNRAFYICFRDAHRTALQDATIPDQINCNGDLVDTRLFNADGLKQRRDAFRKRMTEAYIFGSIFYLLNIIDAYVDAHLQSFDISEDLSLVISPYVMPDQYVHHYGLTTTIKF